MAAETDVGSTPARAPMWHDPAYRAIAYQLVTIILVAAFGWFVVANTIHNLEKQHIASGFSFLNTTAGFGIGTSLIEYDASSTYGRAFVVSLLNTIFVSALSIVAATVLGFVIGIARLSRNWLVSKLAAAYIEIFRNLPLLLQIFFWYFAVLRALPSARQSLSVGNIFLNIRGLIVPAPIFEPGFEAVAILLALGIVATFVVRRWAWRRQQATGLAFPTGWTGLGLVVGLPVLAFAAMGFPIAWDVPKLQGFNFVGGTVVIPEFVSLLLGLSIYTAAFIAEIVRSGILAVSHGQTEAASALGLSRGQSLRLVIIPQAMRVIIPPLTSEYLSLTKNSSLAAAIAYPDLVSVFAGTVLNQTGQAVETIGLTMLVYLSLSLAISVAMNWYNSRKALVER